MSDLNGITVVVGGWFIFVDVTGGIKPPWFLTFEIFSLAMNIFHIADSYKLRVNFNKTFSYKSTYDVTAE